MPSRASSRGSSGRRSSKPRQTRASSGGRRSGKTSRSRSAEKVRRSASREKKSRAPARRSNVEIFAAPKEPWSPYLRIPSLIKIPESLRRGAGAEAPAPPRRQGPSVRPITIPKRFLLAPYGQGEPAEAAQPIFIAGTGLIQRSRLQEIEIAHAWFQLQDGTWQNGITGDVLAMPPLPYLEWEIVHPASGPVYYYNSVTGESTWEEPAVIAQYESEEDWLNLVRLENAFKANKLATAALSLDLLQTYYEVSFNHAWTRIELPDGSFEYTNAEMPGAVLTSPPTPDLEWLRIQEQPETWINVETGKEILGTPQAIVNWEREEALLEKLSAQVAALEKEDEEAQAWEEFVLEATDLTS